MEKKLLLRFNLCEGPNLQDLQKEKKVTAVFHLFHFSIAYYIYHIFIYLYLYFWSFIFL